MKAIFKVSTDEYSRKILSSHMNFEEDVRVMAFAWYENKVWWTKTGQCLQNFSIQIMYSHLLNSDRQVMVTVGGAVICDCKIPNGYDPETGQEIIIKYLLPIIIYKKQEHGVGLVICPESTLKPLRNRIWRLKPAYYSNSRLFFEPALSKTRHGSMLGFSMDCINQD